MLSLGLDIGGANTKAILLKNGKTKKHFFEYIPLWKEKEKLYPFLKNLAKSANPDVVGATLTGELCDVFETKCKGVIEIVETICGAFRNDPCLFISIDGELLERDEALAFPEKLAAANWVASALVVARKFPDCIFMDVGSTTVDIVPIIDGKPASLGKTDFQRLKSGELVYTGILRTPLACVCSVVRTDGEEIRAAAENFAIMADVYKVLDMIGEKDYTCETPDGRGKDKKSCMQRIARTFCSDLDEVGENFVVKVAENFRENQTRLVESALNEVLKLHGFKKKGAVVAGLGRKILAEGVARAVGFEKIVDLANVYGEEAALMTPAFSMGLLAGEVL